MEKGAKRCVKQQYIEDCLQYAEQVKRGRPSSDWSLCNNPECDTYDKIAQPRWNNVLRNSGMTSIHLRDAPRTFWFIMRKLSTTLYPDLEGELMLLAQSNLESFFMSPPVGHAFTEIFKTVHKPTEEYGWLAEEIQQVIPFVEMLITNPNTKENHEKIHFYLDPLYRFGHVKWQRRDHFVRYFLMAEMWRQRPSPYRKVWDFGPPKKICDLLGGLLLTTWTLVNYQILDWKAGVAGQGNEVWELWLERYPRPEVMKNEADGVLIPRRCTDPRKEEEVLREVGYIGGFGMSREVPLRFVARPKRPKRPQSRRTEKKKA